MTFSSVNSESTRQPEESYLLDSFVTGEVNPAVSEKGLGEDIARLGKNYRLSTPAVPTLNQTPIPTTIDIDAESTFTGGITVHTVESSRSNSSVSTRPIHSKITNTENGKSSNTVISPTDKRGFIARKIGKNRRRGSRGNYLKNNPTNNCSYERRCAPRTVAQEGKLRYHRKIVDFFQRKKSDNSLTLRPTELKCAVCEKDFNSCNQLSDHVKSSKHLNQLWNCTPKYCAPCGIFWGFNTKQLWEAHISSKKHNTKISKLPDSKKTLTDYGFIH